MQFLICNGKYFTISKDLEILKKTCSGLKYEKRQWT